MSKSCICPLHVCVLLVLVHVHVLLHVQVIFPNPLHIQLLLSSFSSQTVGIAVEFCSHIVRWFVSCSLPTRTERAHSALQHMGTSVRHTHTYTHVYVHVHLNDVLSPCLPLSLLLSLSVPGTTLCKQIYFSLFCSHTLKVELKP